MPDTPTASPRVQQLIDRLRDEGVQAGEQEAQRLLDEARKQAAQIVADAKAEAQRFQNDARATIERENQSAQAALKIAIRDTVLELRSEITARFAAQVKRLVSTELRDKEFLRLLILALAARAAPAPSDDRAMEIRLANELFADKAAVSPEVQQQLRETILGITADLLREGVELKPAGDDRPGMRVRLAGEDVEIDVTDEAVSAALLKHLLPRFRDVVDGVQS